MIKSLVIIFKVMASYWKSQPRKFCEVCKCWIGDNRASIDFHERGKSHQEKKKKQLDQIQKRGRQQAKDNAKAGVFLKQAEQAARKQYLKDLEQQGVSVNAEEFMEKEQSTRAAIASKPLSNVSKLSTNKPKPTVKQFQAVDKFSDISAKPSTATSAQPYGKWTVIEPSVETTTVCNPTFAPTLTKPAEIKFTEKRVSAGAIDTEKREPVAFKKRKTNSRSIRTKLNDD